MSNDIPSYFADMVMNVSHANGVYRITFAQQTSDKQVKPVFELFMPGSKLAAMLQGISGAATEIVSQVRGADEQSSEQPEAKKIPESVKKKPKKENK